MAPAVILSSDSHVFEPPDLWMKRIDAAFRDRAPRMQRIDGADQIVIEADQILSGHRAHLNAGARFEAPETISGQGRFEDVPRGRLRARAAPSRHGARRGGGRGALPLAGPLLLPGGRRRR